MAKTIHNPAYQELITSVVQARKAAKLTQQDVADRLSRSQSFVAKIEGLERRLDVVELCQLAKAIGFDPVPQFSEAWAKIQAT